METKKLIGKIFVGAAITVFFFAQSAPGQTTTNSEPPARQDSRTKADENFELNIQQDRITETDFERSTSVEINDERRGGLHVGVGVGVRAERIDVLLRGVYGSVRFRASLAPVLERLERLQKLSPSRSEPR